METTMQKPTEQQRLSIATEIKDSLLPRWEVERIITGIARVGVTRFGFVQDVYLRPGLFGQLSDLARGNQDWSAFELNGWSMRRWQVGRK